MVQNMASEKTVFEKPNELNYKRFIVIAQELNFKEQNNFLYLK